MVGVVHATDVDRACVATSCSLRSTDVAHHDNTIAAVTTFRPRTTGVAAAATTATGVVNAAVGLGRCRYPTGTATTLATGTSRGIRARTVAMHTTTATTAEPASATCAQPGCISPIHIETNTTVTSL